MLLYFDGSKSLHRREQLKLKLQGARMKEAVAKGVEIGMKKAKES